MLSFHRSLERPPSGPRDIGTNRANLALKRLAEIGLLLHGPTRLEEVLRAVLVTATAGQGAGMNRAFLLLHEEGGEVLRGELAVGPSNAEEASRIWSALQVSGRSLAEMVGAYGESVTGRDVLVNDIVRRLTIPIDCEDDILVQVLDRGGTRLVGKQAPMPPEARRVADVLGAPQFVVAPVLGRKRSLGVLVADNLITERPLTRRSVELLELLAGQAGLAIENARLRDALARNADELGQAYEALRAEQEKLVRAERLSAVGEMAARVAHEIRNPLVSIGGYARRLLSRVPDGDSVKGEYLKVICDEVERLEEVVGGVLDYVRPPLARIGLVDVGALLRSCAELMISECDRAGIVVTIACAEGLPPLPADESRLRQALLNLSRNAIQAMPDGGRLELAASLEGGSIALRIRDSGEGMDPDQLEKIFVPFYTTKSHGTGLGLAIASQVVEALGGRIEVDSGRGRGSEFTIRLPFPGAVT
jgi:signal transduction histidine kinase